MNSEIKDRFEKIRNYIVPEGYKKTKIGIIPVEWKETDINDIGQFIKGKGISKSELVDQGLNCITYGEIYTVYDFFIKKFHSFINEQSAKNSTRIIKGDILFAGSGETAEEIGKTVAYLGEEKAYAGGDIIILRPPKNNSIFVSYFLNSFIGVSQKRKLGQGYSVVHIYPNLLKKIKIILPNDSEQSRIANILSTWDKAIELKEKLIEQKKLQKKGLMQLLLTGKKRVINPETGKPFDDEWEEVRLGEVCIVIMGQSPNSINYNTNQKGLILLQGNLDLLNRKTNPRIWTTEITKTCEIGDIIMTVRAPVGYVARSLHKACLGRGVCAIRPNKIPDYFFQFLLYFEVKWNYFSQGSTFKAVSGADIRNLKIFLPSFNEKQEIASVLSLADKEIELLENELGQLKEQKRGLMQLLLTGIVRV